MKVMIVDDSMFIRAAMSKFMDDSVISCEAASSDEAINLYSEKRPDVVFLDMMMEEKDSGLKTIREIKSLDKDARIVIVTSLDLTNPLIEEAEKYGLYGVIKKPFSKADIDKYIHSD